MGVSRALTALDRNPMRMYLLLAVAVVLVIFLLYALYAVDRGLKAVRRGQRRRTAGLRLAAAAAYAEEEDRQRREAKESSGALTSVMPAINDRGPRRVA
jgi:hypothetical protein